MKNNHFYTTYGLPGFHTMTGQIFFYCIILWLFSLHINIFAQSIKHKTLRDGVQIWYRENPQDKKPRLFQHIEEIFNVILPPKDKLPFGQSIAFLVGVSRYEYIQPQLPFVANDLQDLREFLLGKGGFDVVYVLSNKVATAELVEDYMTNRFRKQLGARDRLLFYYSGHGADLGGTTGYIQFSLAKKDDFARHVLPIKRCLEWSTIIPASHILFIYDCCASGLAFADKSGDADAEQQLLSTLSGNSSRNVITAGTAKEKAYEVKDRKGRGNGVFTRAFLNSVESGEADLRKNGLMTLNGIFAVTEMNVKGFAAEYQKKLTPKKWELDSGQNGTFVFVNPMARNLNLPREYSKKLHARPIARVVAEYGMIRLRSFLSGKVYFNNDYQGEIESGEEKEYDSIIGKHRIKVSGKNETVSENVTVIKGATTNITIRSKSKQQPLVVDKTETKTPTPPVESKFKQTHYLRSRSKTLSYDDMKKMLAEKKLFDKYKNKTGTGIPHDYEPRTISGKKVVIDHATGLMWQQSGSDNYMTYEKAKQFIKDLNKGEGFAGYKDWRLPTLEEAMSLMEPVKNKSDTYIDEKFDSKQWWIWTSDKESAGVVWVVYFFNGNCDRILVNDGYYVRAVR